MSYLEYKGDKMIEERKEVAPVTKAMHSPKVLMNEMFAGLDDLIPDEVLRSKVKSWIRGRLVEMVMVIAQQSSGIETLSLVLDDVLSKLRALGSSGDKGWLQARSILNEVISAWQARSKAKGGIHAGGREEESIESNGSPPSSKDSGEKGFNGFDDLSKESDSSHSPSSGADSGGEKKIENMS
jgi:hypothetical protein